MKEKTTVPTYAMTVQGRLHAALLGFTLPHEHVLFDISTEWLLQPKTDPEEARKRQLAELPVSLEILEELRRDPMINRDNLVFLDEEIAAKELQLYQNAGGKTIVDVTPPESGRRPEALRRISQATGVNIIIGTGHYIQAAHPPNVAQQSAEELAQWMIDEIREGIGETGIRPGVIGEIGCSEDIPPDERKMLQAAAMAQNETGLPISIHPPVPYGYSPLVVVDVLEDSGAQLDRVIMGHIQFRLIDLDLQRTIAARGVALEYDGFGHELYWESFADPRYAPGQEDFRQDRDWDVAGVIAQLVQEGYADRILLSHDVGYKISFNSFGGPGLAHIQNHVLRYLRNQGVSDAEIIQMTVENNARLFGIRVPVSEGD